MSVEFTDPFHRFMEECMESKRLKGQPREVVQQELADCVRAWNRAKETQVVEDIDEEQLALDFLEGRR